ncbi:MAG: HEAT repeat domain-containing protein [Planctomycetes bacterium]|nr:HEAT repeat domain-containing protein [Planctomycetota bacterium]
MTSRIVMVAVFLVMLCLRPAMAQRGLQDIPVPDPVAELAAMQVADGYEVNLFAGDPMITKPLQMNFDPQGRLWVSSSSVYPQIRPGEVANDTVTILEDRDGDGRADSHTLFADGLLMPTAVVPGDGGAYVANSTEFLHLTDSDGDGRADTRRVVLSGFGAEDTHHIIHTFRWGPDARLYFNQSIYIHSHIETPQGVRRLNGGGIWRFAPESLALDVFARGWVNTWGHAFDRWGRSLVTDGAGGEGIYYGFPGAAYQTAVGASRILHGMNPGSPKYCGLEVIDGRHLPDDAQGQLVTNDFRANRVCRFRLTEQGSGFTSEKLPDLIHSTRVTFRPIDVKMGPDGAIYIADWYNPIIQHGEVDFRDPRRDREHGRIWRVTAKGRKTTPRIDFTKLSTADLLGHLRSPEGYARDMARRVLFSLGSDAVVPELTKWLTSIATDDPDRELLQLEALRLRQGLDRGAAKDIDPALLTMVLASPDPRARAAAARIVCDWADRLDDPVAALAPAVDDASPLVRLEAVRALATLGGRRAAELALHAVDQPRDDALDYAVWLAARELKSDWLPAVIDGSFADDGRFGRVIFAVKSAKATEAVPRIVEALAQSRVADADRSAALAAIATLGDPSHLRLIFDIVVNPSTPAAQTAALLGDLLESYKRRRTVPAGDLAAVERLVANADDVCATRAIEATAAWQVVGAVDEVAAVAAAESRSMAVRQAAVVALGGMPGDDARVALLALCQADASPGPLVAAAIAALVPRSSDAAAARAADYLARCPDAKERTAIFQAFLSAKGAATKLAAALERSQSPLSVNAVKDGQQAVSACGRQEPGLAGALAAALVRADSTLPRTGQPPHAMTEADLEVFVKLVRGNANARRGEAIYARENLKCVACHRIGDQGGRVGPNLTAIGASSPLDYVIDSLIQPAKNVKEGYSTLVVQTAAGQVLTGIQVSRSADELVLRDATGKEVKILAADIDEESVGTSLMPAGLIDGLSREELADLVRYLSELGR